ncbi:hypothetical protein C8R30_103138 [Nitrosomonas nitrosa]|uniref:DUF5615 domain-containing protein n=1 Tax=Nitrosomonas nitrosa TaxID=52442 RepID=A0A1I4N9R0_9PROT|nr:DUF5615 family PIN-like protein [Nitrosomonas nitrosa]MCO6434024.1 DUF5615 family PIN-like protein [Nitrosomonas nitrosa]PTR04620.1 hypothetical protein C8R30_103138 [Nitrosomonas nitrosa]SFM12302.1 hypothetical protein SAMN05421880_10719 [Nitrosomonas nitrosa]
MQTSAGFEAAHGSALGTYNASDSEIMAYAKANDYIVLTHVLEFHPAPISDCSQSGVFFVVGESRLLAGILIYVL